MAKAVLYSERDTWDSICGDSKVYFESDWLDVKTFVKRVAEGRSRANIATEVEYRVRKQFYVSPTFAIRNFLYTVDKEADLVAIDPWVGQTILDLCQESQRRAGRAQRVIEIKARQLGWTTYNLGKAFWAALHPRMKVGMLVNDDDVAAAMMQKVGEMYNNLPGWMRPMKRIDNPKQLVLDNPDPRTRDENPGLGSQIIITVPNSLRGFTPNYFIWSEMAFTAEDKMDLVFEGVIGGMGKHKKSCVIIDTTPNGHDEYYKPMVEEAVERNPKWVKAWERKGAPTREDVINGILGQPDDLSDWVPAFCPWHWHEEYTTQDEHPAGQLPPLSPEEVQHIRATLGKLEKYGGAEEIELVERFGVSIYRIAWRRSKINDLKGSDQWERLLKFRQEYPTTWYGGFVNFGRGVFSARGLEKLAYFDPQKPKYGVREPLARGMLRRDDKGKIFLSQRADTHWGEVRIWALPERGEEYVMGVDTSIAYHSPDADSNVAIVLRRRDRKQVATLDMKLPPQDVIDQTELLYRWYNDAYLGIEMENNGYDMSHQLYRRGCRNQYFYRRFDVVPDEPPTKGLGWETNGKTRPTLQGCILRAVDAKDEYEEPEPDLIITDAITMQQLRDVTRDKETGVIENDSGGHDDHFMALAIALAIDEDPWKPYAPRSDKAKRQELNALVRRSGLRDQSRSDRNHPQYADL